LGIWVSDPGGADQDPDPTLDKESDPDLAFEKEPDPTVNINAILIRNSKNKIYHHYSYINTLYITQYVYKCNTTTKKGIFLSIWI